MDSVGRLPCPPGSTLQHRTWYLRKRRERRKIKNELPIPSRRTSLPSSERALPAEGPKGISDQHGEVPVEGHGAPERVESRGEALLAVLKHLSFSQRWARPGHSPCPAPPNLPLLALGIRRVPVTWLQGESVLRKATPVRACPYLPESRTCPRFSQPSVVVRLLGRSGRRSQATGEELGSQTGSGRRVLRRVGLRGPVKTRSETCKEISCLGGGGVGGGG